MQTVRYYYDKLPDGISQAAYSNLERFPIILKETVPTPDLEVLSLMDALSCFEWWNTQEGLWYWLKIALYEDRV